MHCIGQIREAVWRTLGVDIRSSVRGAIARSATMSFITLNVGLWLCGILSGQFRKRAIDRQWTSPKYRPTRPSSIYHQVHSKIFLQSLNDVNVVEISPALRIFLPPDALYSAKRGIEIACRLSVCL